jgi:glycosyltransferase involved in cell wall biosynthesis
VPRFVLHFCRSEPSRSGELANTAFVTELGPLEDELRPYCDIVQHRKRCRLDFGTAAAIRRCFAPTESDVLMVHGNPWGVLAAWRYRLPTVVVFHVDPGGNGFEGIAVRWLLRRLLRRPNCRAVAVSTATQRRAAERLKVPAATIARIYNGVPLTASEALAPQHGLRGARVLCVGSLCSTKGQSTLVDAIAFLRRQGLEVRCTLVGDGPLRGALERQCRDVGVGDLVVFEGARPAQPFLSDRSNGALVVPSLFEPFGFVILEGWQACLPVIAAAVEGPSELITDGKSGVLFAAGDSVALAGAIKKVLLDASLASRLVREGAARVTDFAIDQTVDTYRRVFEEVVGGTRPVGARERCEPV